MLKPLAPAGANVQLCLKTDLGLTYIGRYQILSTQNEGGLTRSPVRHPLGAIDGGLTGGYFGNSSILGGHASKADSYHSQYSDWPLSPTG